MAGKKYLVSVDIGTTSTRAIVFDETADAVVTHQIEYDQIYPHPGWHEQRHEDLIGTVYECLDGVAAALGSKGIALEDIPGIGITNQRETTCVWSRKTGKPLCNGGSGRYLVADRSDRVARHTQHGHRQAAVVEKRQGLGCAQGEDWVGHHLRV